MFSPRTSQPLRAGPRTLFFSGVLIFTSFALVTFHPSVSALSAGDCPVLHRFSLPAGSLTLQHTRCATRGRIDHVGIVVYDLSAAKAFFLDFGLEVQGEGELEGELLDQVKKGTEIFSEIQTYENEYKLCYVRGSEGIILELAEQIK